MDILSMLGTALFGAGTGGIGMILGGIAKAFTWWADQKAKEAEHQRVVDLTKLQHDLRLKEAEVEREITLDEIAGRLREASYDHDSQTGKAARWVINILRLVRPALTLVLVGLVGAIYFFEGDALTQQEITHAIIFMATSAVTWWFGDRMTDRKR